MSKQKSFNVDEGAHFKRCVAAGTAAGTAIALVLLPAAWHWLKAWVTGIAATLTSFGTAAAPELPDTMFQNPLARYGRGPKFVTLFPNREAFQPICGHDARFLGITDGAPSASPPRSRKRRPCREP